MRIAREGYPLVCVGALMSAVAWAVGWRAAGGVLTLFALAIAGFFRDPERRIPSGEGLIVAPADGRVVSIVPVKGDSFFEGTAARVSIFLSPLDVHINRAPVESVVEAVRRRQGKFFAAYKEDASDLNEQIALRLIDTRGRKLGVAQIAGVMARRIVCRVRQGDRLARGERFGLIMFGSRTDLYLPDACRVEVVEGQKVKGGETIIGRFL